VLEKSGLLSLGERFRAKIKAEAPRERHTKGRKAGSHVRSRLSTRIASHRGARTRFVKPVTRALSKLSAL